MVIQYTPVPQIREDPQEYTPSREEKFWNSYEPEEQEQEFMAKHDILWPLVKTAESLIPFGKASGMFTRSGRAEWKDMSVKEKIFGVGMDTLVVTPLPWLGKGLRAVSKLSGASKIFAKFKPSKFTIQPMEKIQSKLVEFIDTTPGDILIRKHGLQPGEFNVVMGGSKILTKWMEGGGASEALKEIVTKSVKGSYNLKRNIRRSINYAKKPRSFREAAHYSKQWSIQGKAVMGDAYFSKQNLERTLVATTEKLLGKSLSPALTLESASPRLFANLAAMIQDSPHIFKKMSRLGQGGWIPPQLSPTRYIFGLGDELLGTYGNVYLKGKEAFESARKYSFEAIGKIGANFAEEGLGRLVIKKTGEQVFKFHKKFLPFYDEAGEQLVKFGEMAAQKVPAKELMNLWDELNPVVQKFMLGWFKWTDMMYAEHMQYIVPRLFKEAGIKPGGVIELDEIFLNKRNGILQQVVNAFKAEKDVFTYNKSKVAESALGQLRDRAELLAKDGLIPAENLEKLLQRLTFMDRKSNKEGFINYLDNYVTRLGGSRQKTHGELANWLGSKKMRAFYTKQRVDPLGHDMSKVIGDLVEARARAQGNEIFFYP
ncbi:hypothetical protein LCGC14_2208760, partial [marine sediment metagenome]